MQSTPICLMASMSRSAGSFSTWAMVILAALIASGALVEIVVASSIVSSNSRSVDVTRFDQANSQGLLGIDPHPRIHQKPCPGWPDQRDQIAQAVIAIGNAELGGGNAELAVFGGDPDIRQHRDLHAAAEAVEPRIQAMVGFG